MRFDVALFELRLFKSRSAAKDAIESGAVRLNGARVKPSREVSAGDRIELEGSAGAIRLEILELPRASLSKEAASKMVREVSE